MPSPSQQVVFQEYINAINEATARVDRLTKQIETLVPAWRMAPVVTALQALRGVSLIVATTMIAEIGDLTRFEHPKLLMAYLGLVPSEHSSGYRRNAAALPRPATAMPAGTGRGRPGLQPPARITRPLLKRQEG